MAGYETCNMYAADKVYSARFWLETNSVNLDSCSLQLDDGPALHQKKMELERQKMKENMVCVPSHWPMKELQ
jgi:hypothetical protein